MIELFGAVPLVVAWCACIALAVTVYSILVRAEMARSARIDEMLERWDDGIDAGKIQVGTIDWSRVSSFDGTFVVIDESVPIDEKFVAACKTLSARGQQRNESHPLDADTETYY